MNDSPTDETTVIDVVDRFDGGCTWIGAPTERLQRASHVLEDDQTWIVEPVDGDGVDTLLAEYQPLTGVVVLMDRHTRDAAAIAARHDLPVYVPRGLDKIADKLPVRPERFETLPGTELTARTVLDSRFWQEAALYDGQRLLIPEALGTAPYFRTAAERLGVHPALRGIPPRTSLSGLTPDRILVGHGTPITDRATSALGDALAGSRRRLPALYGKLLREVVRG